MLKNVVAIVLVGFIFEASVAQASFPASFSIFLREFQTGRNTLGSEFRLSAFFDRHDNGLMIPAFRVFAPGLAGTVADESAWSRLMTRMVSARSGHRSVEGHRLSRALDEMLIEAERAAFELHLQRVSSQARSGIHISDEVYLQLAEGLIAEKLGPFWSALNEARMRPTPSLFYRGSPAQEIRQMSLLLAGSRQQYEAHRLRALPIGWDRGTLAAVQTQSPIVVEHPIGWTREMARVVGANSASGSAAALPRWVGDEHPVRTITKMLDPWPEGRRQWVLNEGSRVEAWRSTLPNGITIKAFAFQPRRTQSIRPDIRFSLTLAADTVEQQRLLDDRIRQIVGPYQELLVEPIDFDIDGAILDIAVNRREGLRLEGYVLQEAITQAWMMPAPAPRRPRPVAR